MSTDNNIYFEPGFTFLSELIFNAFTALGYIEGQTYLKASDILDKVGGLKDDILGNLKSILDQYLGNTDGILGSVLKTIENKVVDGIGKILTNANGAVIDIKDVSSSILGDLGNFSKGQLQFTTNTINAGVTQSFAALDGVTNAIGGTIDDLLDKVIQALKDAINTMTQGIRNALQGAIDAVTTVVSGVVNKISDVVNSAISGLTNMLSGVVDGIKGLVNSAVSAVQSVADKVFNAVADTVAAIKDNIVTTFNAITKAIGDEIDKAGQFISSAVDAIKSVGEGILNSAEAIYGEIKTGIGDAIDGLVGATESVVSGIRSGLTDLEAALQKAFDQVGPILKDYVATPLTDAAKGAYGFMTDSFNEQMSKLIIPPEDDIKNMLTQMGIPQAAIDRIIGISSRLWNGNTFVKNVFLIFLGIQICLAFAQQVAAASGVKLLQEVQPGFSVALPDTGSIGELQRQGVLSDGDAQTIFERSGFSIADAGKLLNLKKRFPEIGIVQVWMLRGFVTRDVANAMLVRLGFSEDDSTRLLDMAFFIPPPSDLITMAVREAFTPDIAEKFGQFENFPEDFAKYGAQQGISEDWAKRYWAAHWALPSVQMGFEMLHRRVIDADTLAMLLRAHDVMPFWRDKLTAISYNPLTRVDIRRMHQLGVLAESEVNDAYLDLGYTPDNAKRLTTFTVQLNKRAKATPPENLEALTREAVVKLYAAAAIDRTQAEDLLKSIGIGPDAVSIYLDISDLTTQSADRAKQTQLIIHRAKVGDISFTEAQDQLHSLGLEALEIQRALVDLATAQAAISKHPTHDELDKLLQNGLIEGAIYISTMLLNGYSAFWAERFYELAKKGIKKQ